MPVPVYGRAPFQRLIPTAKSVIARVGSSSEINRRGSGLVHPDVPTAGVAVPLDLGVRVCPTEDSTRRRRLLARSSRAAAVVGIPQHWARSEPGSVLEWCVSRHRETSHPAVPDPREVPPEPPTLLSHRRFSAVSPPNFAHFTPFFARSLRLGARKPETAKER